VAAPEVRVIDQLIDRGWLPDPLIRAGIRQIVAARLREQEAGGVDAQSARFRQLLSTLAQHPIAVRTDAANHQHYELPPAFFERVLGPHLKYSSAWWPDGVTTLAEAETRMLALTAARAQVADGQRILELGCGWGSLTLYLAAALSRSRTPRRIGTTSPRRRESGGSATCG
jgi:cyclopropane-fatty-acyl-phospholipid synthase